LTLCYFLQKFNRNPKFLVLNIIDFGGGEGGARHVVVAFKANFLKKFNLIFRNVVVAFEANFKKKINLIFRHVVGKVTTFFWLYNVINF